MLNHQMVITINYIQSKNFEIIKEIDLNVNLPRKEC